MSESNQTGNSPDDSNLFQFSRIPSTTATPSSSASAADVLRRSSSRSIKRKKFDDEVVDTSNPFKRMPSSRRSSESSQPDQKPSLPPTVSVKKVAIQSGPVVVYYEVVINYDSCSILLQSTIQISKKA